MPKGSAKNIINIINYAIKELNLFTNSKTHDVVIDRFENDPDRETVNYIATSGYPKEEMQCRECGYMLPSDWFSFYQTRVSQDGYLMRSNAICKVCAEEINQKRKGVLDGSIIPDKPKSGSVCPNCNRIWKGNWHRHHVEDEFKEWWCGICNMAHQDQRNAEGYK